MLQKMAVLHVLLYVLIKGEDVRGIRVICCGEIRKGGESKA